jgi:sRNA-binding carbon storage regulator CsrA
MSGKVRKNKMKIPITAPIHADETLYELFDKLKKEQRDKEVKHGRKHSKGRNNARDAAKD